MKYKLTCLRRMRMQDSHDRRYNKKDCSKDDLFLTVADGDFAFLKVIENDVINSVKTRSLAYSFLEKDDCKQIIKYYNLDIYEEDILFGNGVLY